MFVLKDNGDDFGSVKYFVEMDISVVGVDYKTKTLYTTGKDGFTFFEYMMTSAKFDSITNK